MIPAVNSILDVNQTIQQDSTYAVDFEKGCITGMISGLKALEQTVFIILSTERYLWEIYSWSYGSELGGLIGKPMEYALSEIQRRITEALMQDDRIIDVTDFEFNCKGRTVNVSFSIKSNLNSLQLETEVKL